MNYLNQMLGMIRGLFGTGRSASSEQLQLMTRAALVARSVAFYLGFAPPQLKVKPGEPDDNVYINYAQVVVDKGVSFLFGKPLVISVGTDADRSGEEHLEQVWPQAQRDEEFQEMAQDGATHGDAYLKINIERTGQPRVTVGDPACYQIVCDPHDVSRPVLFRCAYPLMDGTGREYLFKEETERAEDGEAWFIRQSQSYDGGNAWSPVGIDVTWNFPFPPIFHCKNLPEPKSPYGKPDLTEPELKVIAYISRLDSMCGKVVRVHSTPKPYAKGLRKQDLEWGTDGMLFLGNGISNGQKSVEAEIGLLEMRGDLANALAYRKVLREGLAEMTGVPEVATGKMEHTGQLAGVALRIMYGPLIEKTEKKQLRYGRMISECVKALLVIGGKSAEAVKLNWTDPLPGDEKEKVDVAEGKKRLGVSPDTLLQELSYDPKQEREKNQLYKQDTGTALRGDGLQHAA